MSRFWLIFWWETSRKRRRFPVKRLSLWVKKEEFCCCWTNDDILNLLGLSEQTHCVWIKEVGETELSSSLMLEWMTIPVWLKASDEESSSLYITFLGKPSFSHIKDVRQPLSSRKEILQVKCRASLETTEAKMRDDLEREEHQKLKNASTSSNQGINCLLFLSTTQLHTMRPSRRLLCFSFPHSFSLRKTTYSFTFCLSCKNDIMRRLSGVVSQVFRLMTPSYHLLCCFKAWTSSQTQESPKCKWRPLIVTGNDWGNKNVHCKNTAQIERDTEMITRVEGKRTRQSRLNHRNPDVTILTDTRIRKHFTKYDHRCDVLWRSKKQQLLIESESSAK